MSEFDRSHDAGVTGRLRSALVGVLTVIDEEFQECRVALAATANISRTRYSRDDEHLRTWHVANAASHCGRMGEAHLGDGVTRDLEKPSSERSQRWAV